MSPAAVSPVQQRATLSSSAVVMVVALLWLMAGPRIDLVAFAGSSVRVEDALLAGVLVLVVGRWRVVRPLIAGRTGIAAVTWVSIAAAVCGALLGTIHLAPGLLYAIRPLEYWAVFPFTLLLLKAGAARAETVLIRVLAVTTVAHSAVAVGQYLFGLNIGFSAFSVERGAGLTNGPYELGAISAMLICFWVHERRLLMACVSAAGLLMSLSRISIVGAVVGLGFMAAVALVGRRRAERGRDGNERTLPRPSAVIAVTAIAVVLLCAAPAIATTFVQPALERTKSTSVSSSWTAGRDLAAITPEAANSDQYAAIAYDAIGTTVLDNVTSGDASNEVRFYRWNLLLNEIGAAPHRALVGLGPSFAGPSVDGAYLRILVESGIAGLIAWLVMFARWLRRAPAWFIGAALSLFVGGAFIDIFYAERPMIFLWVLLAIVTYRARTRTEEL